MSSLIILVAALIVALLVFKALFNVFKTVISTAIALFIIVVILAVFGFTPEDLLHEFTKLPETLQKMLRGGS
ncbi:MULTISPECIES: hypothetical protein [Nostocales]|uniref:Uncharacterized protein n=3 Tax=Nostocales TaxID=1161 RepID=A0A0C1R374_9CYAN|nr:hypothetical protein [Tolypothrix bouteillei]KAF3890697.1 hypothetical protein DA73_0400038595 [Tolypothrix bouteillei VB521301]